MTDNLFHEIPDAQVVLRSKGVYRQAKLFRRGGDIYAAWGSGYIRLLKHSGTTVPAVSWLSVFDGHGHNELHLLGSPAWRAA